MGGRNASEWRKSVKKTDGGGLFGVRCLFIPPGEGDTDARGETDDVMCPPALCALEASHYAEIERNRVFWAT